MEAINKNVLREGGDNVNYVLNTIKYKETVGLYDDSNKLQGWVFGIDMGTMGTAGVTNEHSHKGGASALGVAYSKMMAKDHDMVTVWHVNHGNSKSHGLARKFMAKDIGTVTWMAVNKRTSAKMTQMGMFQIYYPSC